ncbi:MAG: MFS transporter, partial [Planctomycetota bacterium]
RVGEVNFSILGSLLLSAGLAGVAMGEALTAIFMLPVAVLGYSMLSPSLASLLSRRTPAEMQGEMLGLNQSGLALARILGPWIGNVLFDLSPETPYWGSAAIMLLAFLAAFGLKRR